MADEDMWLAEAEADPVPRLPSPAALLSDNQRQAAAHKSIHLPSQLGSDVGNAFTTDTQADEKAHMEVIVNGVADRVLMDAVGEQGNGNHVQQDQTHGERFCSLARKTLRQLL